LKYTAMPIRKANTDIADTTETISICRYNQGQTADILYCRFQCQKPLADTDYDIEISYLTYNL